MTIQKWASLIAGWNFLGSIICILISDSCNSYNWDLANPVKCHKICENLNIIGAILLSALYNALCPIGSIVYWFNWICTVGRKKDV